MKLNKHVAHCGVCSRRKAGEIVKAGKVKVNGITEINPAYEVQRKDDITVDGKRVFLERNSVYYLLNKPKNVLCTVKDEKGRKTVIDIVREKVKERVYPVGRLDRATTGLLVLTNDGNLAQQLSHPSYESKKIYKVTLDKDLDPIDLQKIKNGITLEDGVMMPDEVTFADERNDVVILTLHSGKNRIIRRTFEHLQYDIKNLDRVYYCGLTKKGLAKGRFRQLTDREVIMLKHFSSPKAERNEEQNL